MNDIQISCHMNTILVTGTQTVTDKLKQILLNFARLGIMQVQAKFYLKSNWEPPKACVELEKFIKNLPDKFDSWRPPRWIRDNLGTIHK